MARRGHHTLEQIKNMVLLAAEDIVADGGLNQLRVRNIAFKIGYTVGSIYMVFESMNDLIIHLKGRTLDTITGQMDQVQALNAEQKLEGLATVYVQFASNNLNRWSLVFEHRLPENTVVPAWYQSKVDNLYKRFEDQFGLLVPDMSVAERKRTALAFLGGIHGICVLMLTKQLGGLNDNDMEESVTLLIRRFIHDCCELDSENSRKKSPVGWSTQLSTVASSA
jgi:AcrR family transcriptional regulator